MIQRLKLMNFLSIFLLLFATLSFAGDPDYDSVANNLVNAALNVQPGESVLITGTPAEIKLLEALYVSVLKAGGQPVVQLNLPEANKRAIMEMPMEYLKLVPTTPLLMARSFDCQINATSTQDPALFADVPEERQALARKAGATLNHAFRGIRTRSVTLGQVGGIPTQAYAASQGADLTQMNSMFWKASNVNPNEMAESGKQITTLLDPGTIIKIKSDAGTNLTFNVDKFPARVNSGRTQDVLGLPGAAQAWLPAGEAFASIQSSSATGTLVVPHMQFRGMPITNLKLSYVDGKLTDVTADKNGEIIKNFLASSSDNIKDLSIVDFGLNPHSAPVGQYLSYEMGGVVTLGIGNNSWAGGINDADAGLTFHLPETDVWIDDKQLVKKGKLELVNDKEP
jgi:leucyl aminopeptidase (aminopeptidase T)